MNRPETREWRAALDVHLERFRSSDSILRPGYTNLADRAASGAFRYPSLSEWEKNRHTCASNAWQQNVKLPLPKLKVALYS